jgi:cytochrome c5
MNNRLTPTERQHLARVKALPCSVCDAPPVSEAHHIKQGSQYLAVALCESCHRGPILGWHGQKRAWAVRKLDDIDALAVTVKRLLEAA